jgi:hypothetical protein
MDDRTARTLNALDPVGVDLLLGLLGKALTEAELVEAVEEATQPTTNRRLVRLKKARLIAQEPGKAKAPGRLWVVVHPKETEALLAALFTLSDAIDAKDKGRRENAKRKLKRARARRLGIRRVEGEAESP